MSGTAWRATTASAKGSMHVRRDLPNQDAAKTMAIDGGVIAAVADGHGGDRYVRSDIGAQLAVEIACREVAAWWASIDARRPAAAEAGLTRDVAPAIVRAWRAAVLDHARRTPFTDAERARAGEDPDVDPSISYGATMLVALAVGDLVAIAQLGDGDVVVALADGRILTPIAGDSRLVAGQTTSLCLPTAAADFRAAVITAEHRAELVLLSSDGYGNSFADSGWHETVASDMHHELRTGDVDGIAERLPAWLADSAEVGGDDVTVAVLGRRSPSPALPGPSGTTRPWIPTALGAVAGLAVGGLLGYVIRGSGDDAAAPAATSTTSTTDDPTPEPTQPPTLEPITIVGAKGSLIGFVPDPGAPDPRLLRGGLDAAARAWTTRLEVAAGTFEVDDGVLRLNGDRIDLDSGIRPGSLSFAEGRIWVVDADEALLTSVSLDGTETGAAFPIQPL